MPIFTPHQNAALTAASNWLKATRGRASIFRLFGYAGTGKTTLAYLVARLYDVSAGRISIDGREVDIAPLVAGGRRRGERVRPRGRQHPPVPPRVVVMAFAAVLLAFFPVFNAAMVAALIRRR